MKTLGVVTTFSLYWEKAVSEEILFSFKRGDTSKPYQE